MIPHITLVPLEQGRGLIMEGAICAMKGQRRDYWPRDALDDELRVLLMERAFKLPYRVGVVPEPR